MTLKKEHKIINNIENKHCSYCDKWKNLSEYNKCKSAWDNLRNKCKECMKLERIRKKDKITEYNKKYWQKTKDKQTVKHREWYKNNKEKMQEYNKKYRAENLEKLKEKDRLYNKERRKTEEYKIKHREYRRKYDKEKRKNDINFKLKTNMSRRLREILGQKKSKKSIEYFDATIEQIKKHLSDQFVENMTWENYGDWHIDHIIPCNSWNLKDPFEVYCCFNIKNLQPLWATENILKKDKFILKHKIDFMNDMLSSYTENTLEI